MERAHYQQKFEWYDDYVQVNTRDVMKDSFLLTFNGMWSNVCSLIRVIVLLRWFPPGKPV